MSLFLVTSGKFSTTLVAAKRFLTRVCSHMSREVVTPGERSHTDSTLERFLSSVNANVSCEFITSGKATITSVYGTSIRSFVDRSLAGSIRVLPGFDRNQPERECTLLIDLR